MSKILIWRSIVPGDEVDFFSTVEPDQVFANIQKLYGGHSPNWGNKLWFQGLYSEINTPENEIVFRTKESPAEINERFDLIIYPMANIFAECYAANLCDLAEAFREIRIPTFIIACGVQADSYEALASLCEKIQAPASRFIDSIYRTGGQFALRGHFTKQFFDRLGYPQAVVTGCPSLYCLGPDLKIEKKLVDIKDFRVSTNGCIKKFETLLEESKNNVFIDQERFADCLYDQALFQNMTLAQKLMLIRRYGSRQIKLLGEGKIHLFVNLNEWYHFLGNNHFDFSFGSRIHGNIMAILAGTPANVIVIDSRTREMADFYELPTSSLTSAKQYTLESVYQAYLDSDFTSFNQNFSKKYAAYERFLQEHKIVVRLNRSDSFLLKETACNAQIQFNQEGFRSLSKRTLPLRPAFWLADKIKR